jgi:hypothetical protein
MESQMMTSGNLSTELLWNNTQKVHASVHEINDYLRLLSALDAGWMIEEPVKMLRSTSLGKIHSCLFTLHSLNGGQLQHLLVPMNAVLENFLYEWELKFVVCDLENRVT